MPSKRRGNGEGSICRRVDGRWVGRAYVDGRRRAVYGRTREEAATRLRTLQQAGDSGTPVVDGRQTVGEFIGRWLEGVQPTVQPTTFTRYEQYMRVHALPAIGKVRLAKLGPEHLQRLFARCLQSGQSPRSVRHLRAVLHRAFSQAVRWGYLARNVVEMVDPPRVPRYELTTLTADEVRRVLDAAKGDRLEALYVLAVTTGMREGELLALRWEHADVDRGTVRVVGTLQRTSVGLVIAEPKTKSSRRLVQLGPTAANALRKHRLVQREERLKAGAIWRDEDLVFSNQIGAAIEPRNLVRRSFEPLLARAGVRRVRFHDLRHTAATLLLEQAVHPKYVSDMLGHANIAITLDLYSHVTPSMRSEAARVMDSIIAS